jgi:hypothetical protein
VVSPSAETYVVSVVGKAYSIQIKNFSSERVFAEIEVDGQ